jgi:DNA-binding XRE family transcriptional regulator
MEQRDKSMGAGASAKAEAMTDIVRPARYVADPDADAGERSTSAARESRESRETASKEARDAAGQKGSKKEKPSGKTNRLRETRIEKMMSKAELARRANLSVLTIDRVEKGLGCRMDTKRKILEALGLSLADRVRVFGEEE